MVADIGSSWPRRGHAVGDGEFRHGEDAATPQVDRALFQGLQNYTNEVHPYLGEFISTAISWSTRTMA